MKVIVYILLLTTGIVLVGRASAQELVPYRKGTLWGFSDLDGKVIIAPKYERTWFFSDGLARIKSRGLIGYVDTSGNMIIPPLYTRAGDFQMGIAEVERNNKSFCINMDGTPDECIPHDDELSYEDEYDPFEIYQDSTGYVLVLTSTGDSIQERFDHIVEVKRYVFPSTSYFALVSKSNLWGAYNDQGMPIAPVAFSRIDVLDVNTCKVMINNYWGVRSTDGTMVVPAEYDSISKVTDVQVQNDKPVKKEFFVVVKNKKFGVLDGRGTIVIPLEYDDITIPSPCNCETDFVVRRGNQYGIVDTGGKVIVPIRYAYAEPFNGQSFALVRDANGREGYIRRDGKEMFTD